MDAKLLLISISAIVVAGIPFRRLLLPKGVSKICYNDPKNPGTTTCLPSAEQHQLRKSVDWVPVEAWNSSGSITFKNGTELKLTDYFNKISNKVNESWTTTNNGQTTTNNGQPTTNNGQPTTNNGQAMTTSTLAVMQTVPEDIKCGGLAKCRHVGF